CCPTAAATTSTTTDYSRWRSTRIPSSKWTVRRRISISTVRSRGAQPPQGRRWPWTATAIARTCWGDRWRSGSRWRAADGWSRGTCSTRVRLPRYATPLPPSAPAADRRDAMARGAWAAALVVACATFALYYATLLPGLDFGDTGSFQTVVGAP